MLDFLLALLTAGTVGVLLIPLLRSRVTATGRRESELALYRDQLAELEREAGAGSVSPADAAAARIEIERRMLAADERASALGARQSTGASSSASLHKFLTPALCLAIPALALGVYLRIGTPGLPSAPFFPSHQAPGTAAEPDSVAREIATLRDRLKSAPDDADANSALGELLTTQSQGVVTQEAVDAFTRALAKTPPNSLGDPRALFYLGLHEAQAGDSKAALKRWLDLEARSPAEAPWLPTLRAEIARVAKEAGLDPQQIKPDRKPPQAAAAPSAPSIAPGMPQPTAEQREAMAKMTPAERQQAIRGMVDGLAAKMRDTPGDRDGWLRLANARRVLGQPDLSAEAYAKADALSPLDPRTLADWAETEVRQIQPGAAPSPQAVAVLARLEKADPDNALALFYLGAADFAKGNKEEAARRWKALLGKLPSDAPIRQMLEAKIKEAE